MKDKLNIRDIRAEDVDLLYKWTNDELVRKQSFSSEVIPYEGHCNWFQKKIKDKNSVLFIVEIDKEPVGVVRFDIVEYSATIGVSIDKEYRGKGLGSEIIKIGVLSYFKKNEFPILATIKKENLASIRSFEKAGFHFLKNELINEVESVVYQLKKNHE